MVARVKSLEIPAQDMFHALSAVLCAASKEGRGRLHIECVYVCSMSKAQTPKGEDGRLDIVATNGHVIHLWSQKLEGAVDRAFSLTLPCAKRIKRELSEVRNEYDGAMKTWRGARLRVHKTKPPLPEPKPPMIVFDVRTYTHPISIGRLDVIENETYPNYRKIYDEFKPRKQAPPTVGVNSAYLAQVCKNFQAVAKNKNVGVRLEYADDGNSKTPMMRFTMPDDLASRLTCLVMPMRI